MPKPLLHGLERFAATTLAALCALAVTSSANASDNGQCTNLDMKPRGAILHGTEVCLGIHFNAATSWGMLDDAQKKEWAEYVDLVQPNVTPPYPMPSAWALLGNITVPEEAQKLPQSMESEPITRVNVHIDEAGKVTRVDMLIKEAETESLLFDGAILNTRFIPAKMNGRPAPSSIILELHRPFRFAERTHAQ